jgi:hypothetical protein
LSSVLPSTKSYNNTPFRCTSWHQRQIIASKTFLLPATNRPKQSEGDFQCYDRARSQKTTEDRHPLLSRHVPIMQIKGERQTGDRNGGENEVGWFGRATEWRRVDIIITVLLRTLCQVARAQGECCKQDRKVTLFARGIAVVQENIVK